MVKHVPFLCLLLTEILPLRFSIKLLTIAKPKPELFSL